MEVFIVFTEYQGKQIEVEEIEVLSNNELWSEYKLKDGTTLIVKNVLISVTKAVSEKLEDGTPIYFVTQAIPLVRIK
jgi:hypothetical protein